ncbi:MAG: peptide deformylase [Ignavibacteria bacterium]|nr:peptide deformylase [Ignavibacteria bacterium]
MALLPIYTYGTNILRKKAKPIDEITDEVITLVRNMFETMHNASGVGLAANQVGVLQRVLVVDISEMEGYENEQPLVMINPEIMFREGNCAIEEGCLSIPGIRGNITRSETITVTYLDLNGKEKILKTDGMIARVVLHEIDHLNGVLFIDLLEREHFQKLFSTLKNIERGEMETEYPIVTARVLKQKKVAV